MFLCRKFFLRTTQAGTAFRNFFGITNTTPLRPNFGPLYALRNHFLKKNSPDYTGNCLEGLRNTKKNLIQDSRPPGQDLNLRPLEREAGRFNCIFHNLLIISSAQKCEPRDTATSAKIGMYQYRD
jgi:hypothetical protein